MAWGLVRQIVTSGRKEIWKKTKTMSNRRNTTSLKDIGSHGGEDLRSRNLYASTHH